MNNNLKLESPWQEVKEKIKEIRPELTDEDLEYAPGQEVQLIPRLAEKMKRTPEDIKGWIESVSFTKNKAG